MLSAAVNQHQDRFSQRDPHKINSANGLRRLSEPPAVRQMDCEVTDRHRFSIGLAHLCSHRAPLVPGQAGITSRRSQSVTRAPPSWRASGSASAPLMAMPGRRTSAPLGRLRATCSGRDSRSGGRRAQLPCLVVAPECQQCRSSPIQTKKWGFCRFSDFSAGFFQPAHWVMSLAACCVHQLFSAAYFLVDCSLLTAGWCSLWFAKQYLPRIGPYD